MMEISIWLAEKVNKQESMSSIIGQPLDILTNKEAHQLYEQEGLLPENNQLDVSFKEMDLCHKHWPDNFEALYDIGVKAFENFLIDRCHLTKHFKVDEVRAEAWRQHFILDRCVLHMLQMLHEAISRYHEKLKEGVMSKDDENFFKKLHSFGGRYRSLAPMVPVHEYFYLFNIWSEMHMDFIALTCYEGPVCNDERSVIASVWEKIIESIKVHFVYGWHHKMYTPTREELEYFAKDKNVETTRSRLMTKLTRLLSRESFSDPSIEEKSSPTRKNSGNNIPSTSQAPTRALPTKSSKSSREEEIIKAEPIEICDINLDLLNNPADCSPLNISNHF